MALPFKYSLFFFLSSLFLAPAINCRAQQKQPSVDSTLFSYSINSADSISTVLNQKLDTLPDNIQYYDPATQNYQAWATQGNIGRAALNLIPTFNLASGFNTGVYAFDLYRFNPDRIKIFEQYYPFTNIYYVMGGKKEQVFNILHSQNIGKLFSVSANLRIFNSPGSYQHQKSDISNLILSGRYLSRNHKYQATLSMCQNILKIQENGGIVKDSIFENNAEPDRRVISVMLTAAENRMRETSMVFYQDYCLLRDSTLIKKPWLKYLPLTLAQNIRYTESTFVYEEPGTTSGFYPFPPQDSNRTQDELLSHQLKNSILLRNPGNQIFDYSAGLIYENIFIRDRGFEGKYAQLASSFDVMLNLPLKIRLRASAGKYYGGYNGGDTYSELRISKSFGNASQPKSRLSLWNRTSNTQPSWIQKHYQTNLVNWEKDFIRIQTNTLGAEFMFKKLELGYRLHTLKNYIINDRITAIPVQLYNDLNLMQLYAQFKIRLWKIILDNRIDYQKVDNEKYLRLPEIITRHSVYFDFKLFNNAMIIQPGFSLYWQSSYYADAYMPVTRSYYLQDQVKLNDQFYADIFINMKVSRARIFVKYQHANSRLGPYDYYQVPHYPVQDAAVRVGCSWLLRDLPDHDKKFIIDDKKLTQ